MDRVHVSRVVAHAATKVQCAYLCARQVADSLTLLKRLPTDLVARTERDAY
jgi:hypothetical protein